MKENLFSSRLRSWLKSDEPKTILSLDTAFGEKSFAVAFLLLMALAALPLPTGGITHIFEVITILLALELIIGRRTLWLPKRWQKVRISNALETKALPKFISFIGWFERFSRPRLGGLLKRDPFPRLVGLVVLIFTLAALLAPPFSGLDTLPALGVVAISLSILLEDIVIFVLGLIAGAAGFWLDFSLGSFIIHFFK